MRAPRFLFLWQLLWLQDQAASIPELSLDSILQTSIPLGPTEPWSWDPAKTGFPSINNDASARHSEVPEKMERSPNPPESSTQLPLQEASTHSRVSSELPPYTESHQSSKSSALPPVPPTDIETSLGHQEATSSLPDWFQVQHHLTVSVDDMAMGMLIKSTPPKKNETSTTEKEVSFYPPRPTENIKPPYQQETRGQPILQPYVLQQTTAPPKYSEVTLPSPQPVQAQQPTFPPLDLGLTITPEPTLVTDAVAQGQTIAPPGHPEITLPYPETVQPLQPTLPEVKALPSDMGVAKIQQPVPYAVAPPVTDQSVTMNVCEFCTCTNGTLSCIGFGKNQKLNKVPVPDPSYTGTFTVLNLQGNDISFIDKETWKSYHLVEKLNLSGNNLREIRKDSFEGLFSLQYLDLSCNKIELIERNAFESLPFLQYINIGCNSITKVNFGTFQTSHGMQFLYQLILDRNPLTTVQDPYLFNLPALKYLDFGATKVSLTTVDNILKMSLTLEKLILPKHLDCCLCQFKNHIEAVTKSVKLHCNNECPEKKHCDEKVLLEGPFMKILQDRENYNTTELTIEPERASSKRNSDTLSAFMGLLVKLLDEQQEVKVSKGELDTDQWKHERMETPLEQAEEESNEFTKEVPEFKTYNKVIIASPVIGVVAFFFVVFCLIVICRSKEPTDESSRGSLASLQQNKSSEYQEEGGFCGRLFGCMTYLCAPILAIFRTKSDVRSQNTAENEAFLKMEQEEATGYQMDEDNPEEEEAGEDDEE